MESTVEERAYLAGLMDGEGSVCIIRRVKTNCWPEYNVQITICNTNLPMLSWIVEHFAGSIKNHTTKSKLGKKPIYRWYMSGKRSKPILETIFPYLIVKKRRAQLALSFLQDGEPAHLGGRGRKITSIEAGRRQALYLACQEQT